MVLHKISATSMILYSGFLLDKIYFIDPRLGHLCVAAAEKTMNCTSSEMKRVEINNSKMSQNINKTALKMRKYTVDREDKTYKNRFLCSPWD